MLLTVCFGLCSCTKTLDSIAFSEEEAFIRVEDTYKVEYKTEPADMTDAKINWSSSDETIATVNENGEVTALAEGEVEISAQSGKEATDTIKITIGKKLVTETDFTKIDGVYIDDSFKDEEIEELCLVYLFYTVKSGDKNIQVASNLTEITVDGNNTYDSRTVFSDSHARFIANYYHKKGLKVVSVDSELKVLEVFKIPKGDLKAGKAFTFKNDYIEQTENLVYLTDGIIHCKNLEEIAQKADPEGYKSEVEKRKPADSALQAKVKENIIDYEWSVTAANSVQSYKLSFWAPNNFTLKTVFSEVDGKFTIAKGYVILTFTSTSGRVVELPYEFDENGKFDIDTSSVWF